jgi:hypothetical protein
MIEVLWHLSWLWLYSQRNVLPNEAVIMYSQSSNNEHPRKCAECNDDEKDLTRTLVEDSVPLALSVPEQNEVYLHSSPALVSTGLSLLACVVRNIKRYQKRAIPPSAQTQPSKEDQGQAISSCPF